MTAPSHKSPSCGAVTQKWTDGIVAWARQDAVGDTRSLVVLPTDDTRGEGWEWEGVEGVGGDRVNGGKWVGVGHTGRHASIILTPLVLPLVKLKKGIETWLENNSTT